MSGVGQNAAHFSCSQEYEIRALLGEKLRDRGLLAQIELCAGGGDNALTAAPIEFANNGRTHQSTVPGYIDAAGV